MRAYRTRHGFRLLVSGADAHPASERARTLMAEMRSDPLYMLLCRVHDTYRARLTPKPWRVEIDRFESLGTRTATAPSIRTGCGATAMPPRRSRCAACSR